MVLVSIAIIFLVHHIIFYLKDTLTVPKVKDMVNIPSKQYEDMYKIIQTDATSPTREKEKEEDSASMKNELKNYLKKQMNQGINNKTFENVVSNSSEEILPQSFSFSDINSLPISSIS